jgi:hypothetical protein
MNKLVLIAIGLMVILIGTFLYYYDVPLRVLNWKTRKQYRESRIHILLKMREKMMKGPTEWGNYSLCITLVDSTNYREFVKLSIEYLHIERILTEYLHLRKPEKPHNGGWWFDPKDRESRINAIDAAIYNIKISYR